MFTIEEFNSAQPGEILRTVITKYQNFQHVNGKELKFVVVKGDSGHDWAIYGHFAYTEYGHPKLDEWILWHGDKVTSKENIMSIFPCTEEVYKLYRF